MSRTKKLAANTVLFAVSNFGSKILTFLLVPFYTHVLNTAQYGTVDIIITTVSMLLPFVTLSMSDAALRFAMDPEVDSKKAFSSALFVVLVGNGLSLAIVPLITHLLKLNEYWFIVYVILFFNSLYSLSAQFSRGISKNVQFAAAGVIQTLVLVVSNIIMLIVFKMGVTGYLYSLVLSYLIPFIFLFFTSRLYKYLTFKIDKKLVGQMAKYALPLIPNTIFWWAMNALDKYVINYFHGTSLNGLYAVSHKIPTILNTFNVIFFQAWQLSAIEEVNAEDRRDYYSRVFYYLSLTMFWVMSAIMLILRPLFSVWTAPEYYDAWKCTPILLFATLFMSFSSFWGSNFIALKKTGGVLKSAAIGAAVNLGFNFLLIPKFELYGAAFSTALGFLVTWLVRVWDSRKELAVRINFRVFFTVLALLIAQIPLLHLSGYMIYQAALFVAVSVICFLSMRDMIRAVLKRLSGKLRRKKKDNG